MTTTRRTGEEIAWINNYINGARIIDLHQVESILCFAFIWNLFEGRMCNQNARISEFEQLVKSLHDKGSLRPHVYESELLYFKSRYISGGATNATFEGLSFRPGDRKPLVAEVLRGVKTDPSSTLVALLIIVFRLRNNLFHGIKPLETIGGQIDNFHHANKLLMRLLELH